MRTLFASSHHGCGTRIAAGAASGTRAVHAQHTRGQFFGSDDGTETRERPNPRPCARSLEVRPDSRPPRARVAFRGTRRATSPLSYPYPSSSPRPWSLPRIAERSWSSVACWRRPSGAFRSPVYQAPSSSAVPVVTSASAMMSRSVTKRQDLMPPLKYNRR